MEKRVFDNIKSLKLSEETFAKLNSIMEEEQQKTEKIRRTKPEKEIKSRRTRNKMITTISNELIKRKRTTNEKRRKRKEKKQQQKLKNKKRKKIPLIEDGEDNETALKTKTSQLIEEGETKIQH